MRTVRSQRTRSCLSLLCVILCPLSALVVSHHVVNAVEEDVSFHGGTVMAVSTVYAIFWLPPGTHFEPVGQGTDARFEHLVEQYFNDVGGTPYYNIVTQYSRDGNGQVVPGGPIQNSAELGGVYEDTSPYPTTINGDPPLASIKRAIAAKGWTPNAHSLFFVFLPHGVQNDSPYHTFFMLNGQAVPYAFAQTTTCPDCDATGQSASYYSPYGDFYAYAIILGVVHEQLEATTDPIIGKGWTDSGGHEIADKCTGQYGPIDANNSDVLFHGHPYRVPMIWSNFDHGCVMSFGSVPGTETPTSTPSITPRSTSTQTPPPTVTAVVTASTISTATATATLISSTTPTNTLTPTNPPPATPSITPTAAATPSPTKNPTRQTSVTIDRVAIVRTVAGREQTTKVLHVGEWGDFVVRYHLSHARGHRLKGRLTITRAGRLIRTATLLPGASGLLHVSLNMGGVLRVGAYFAHFTLRLGPATAKRDRRFQVLP